ncbi:MAG TPA: Pvc16 family protein [Pyrinomonadaceae bacterium]
MSYLAIGAVTRAIAELLTRKMNKPPLLGNVTPKVTTLPPDDDRVDDADGVNLFLYRVSQNPHMSNTPWRGDANNPGGGRRPPLSLTLHYMLTAYAKKADGAALDDVTAHQLLGNAMAVLHEQPVLNDVHDADFDASLDTQFAGELRDSFEKVKVTMAPATMEEFSKIWTGLSKAYRLSVLYDVSLVQIAPSAHAHAAGPPVQDISATVGTLGPPRIASVVPAAGPAGGQLTIKGSNLKSDAAPTVVTVGDVQLAETELLKSTAEEIVLLVPDAPRRGPRLPVVVSCGGMEIAPAAYTVEPWIQAVRPLRGITGVPIEIPFELPEGETVGVEFGGQALAASYDAASATVRAVVPDSVETNGPKPVVLLVGAQPRRSNARFFEVQPRLLSLNFSTEQTPAKTTIELTGLRLAGGDVGVRYGGLLIRKGENSDPSALTVSVPRLLEAGQPVSVVVDGFESNTLPPSLLSVAPAEAAPGQEVVLEGRSLSGADVAVKFGGVVVDAGPHGYSSRLKVAVPPGLAPGDVQLTVEVDGFETNALTFKVSG